MTPDEPAANNEKLALKTLRLDVTRILVGWDPLGMKGLRGGEREYEQYVGPIIVLIRREVKPIDIAAHLDRLCQQDWQLPPQREKCLQVAEKIHRAGGILRGEAPK